VDSRGRITAHQVIPVTVAEAKASGESQENVSKEDNTTSASQQTAATTGVVALQMNSGLPPTPSTLRQAQDLRAGLVLPHKGGGDEEGESVVLTSDERQDAEVEIASGAASPRNDNSSHPHSFDFAHNRPASPIKGEEYSESSAATTGVLALQNQSPSSLSVTIEDGKGNVIEISRIEGDKASDTSSSDVQVLEETNHMILTWQGTGQGKGFVIHRSEKGKDDYTPLSGLIPYFGREGKEMFRYRFIDKGMKQGIKYDYRLEVVGTPQQKDRPEGLSLRGSQ
jgi:hypothetical protein